MSKQKETVDVSVITALLWREIKKNVQKSKQTTCCHIIVEFSM